MFKQLAKQIPKGKICILGCGNGYDAIMFSQEKFQVTAVDFAASPIKYINDKSKDLSLNIKTIENNIFTLSPKYDNQFDYIIEQTCFCAIDINMRESYSKLVKRILKPGGSLIGLWFPLDKKKNEGGPPFGVSINEIKTLFKRGWEITDERFPETSIEPRMRREKLIIFKKL